MSKTAEKTDPKLWDKVKAKVTKGDKGGKPGQWSARKAQLASSEYKKAGGGYKGGNSKDNHLQQWTDEDWGTKSGATSEETGERYLPKEAREHLSPSEYKRTTAKKRADTDTGKQFSAQPNDVAAKVKPYRASGKSTSSGAKPSSAKATAQSGKASPRKGHATRAELYERAKARDIKGRSRMSRDQLEAALASG